MKADEAMSMTGHKNTKDSIVFTGAKIRPFADGRTAQALLIENGVVAAVGPAGDVLRHCTDETKKVNLGGKTVLPGFFDSHIHLVETAKILKETWLGDVRSCEELIERGRRDLASMPGTSEDWIFGRGWNQENMDGKRYPTRHDLDRICADRPMLYQRCCGIVSALNTKGLEVMGIDEHFGIHGGLVDKDENRVPNGVVRREALDGWVKKRLPELSEERARELLKTITALCAASGMTSAQSDDLVMYRDPERLAKLYKETADAGNLAIRVGQQYLLRNPEALETFIAAGHHTGEGNGRFHTGPFKIIVDGSLGSRTAALREDYTDAPGEKGLFVHTDDELIHMMTLAHENGVQTAVTRTNAEGNPPGGWLPDQRLTLAQALRMYTLGSAAVCGEAQTKGTLEPGKFGDFVALAEDPFEVDAMDISAIPVALTVSGGEATYRGDGTTGI